MKKFKVVMCEPEQLAKVVEIEANLENYQSIVDGYIQCIYPFSDNACIICNDEGKINGMSLNRALKANGKIYDAVAGTFFIIGIEGEDFCSLTEAQCKKYKKMFKFPEMFVNYNGKIVAIPMPPEAFVIEK